MLVISRESINKALSLLFIWFVITNNLFFTTDYEYNQHFVIVLASIFMGAITINNKAISKVMIGVLIMLIFYSLFSLMIADDSIGLRRVIIYTIIITVFILIFFNAQYFTFNISTFLIYLYLYVFLAVCIIIVGDRNIVNPNWVSITYFYLLAFFLPRKIIIYLIVGLTLSFFIYESRGCSVSFAAAILCWAMIKKINHRLVRVGLIFTLIFLSIGFFVFLDYFSNNPQIVTQAARDYSDRAFGGRDQALLEGYKLLRESNFLGHGMSSAGGFAFPDSFYGLLLIHIHFGLLDLALKFSILILLFIFIFFAFCINKAKIEHVPFVVGALLTTFYYNGLAPSHYGLNFLLFLLLGRVIYCDVTITSKDLTKKDRGLDKKINL